jgi:hypothetical protein
MSLLDSVRRLMGVRRERLVPPPGPKPRLGARIFKDDVRITVQAGLTDATWAWLVERGWREESFRNSRRHYREVPPSRVAELFDALDADERQQLLELALDEAVARPVVNLNRR